MTSDINISLAIAKQAYEELLGLATLDELARQEFGSDPKRSRIKALLGKLYKQINSIEFILKAHVVESSGAPIVSIPASHRAFYNDVLKPRSAVLQKADYHINGLGILADIVDFQVGGKTRPTQREAMRWGMERWDQGLDEDESFDWLERGFDIRGALKTIEMPWFEPDEWTRNFDELEPVLVDRPAMVMNEHVRYRLIEIYRAFAFGLWMCAIALSRSLVEYSIKQNAGRLGIEVTLKTASDRLEDKSLKSLIEDLAAKRPELAAPLDVVRDTGNRILHPKKRSVISHPTVMRSEALDSIHAARHIVENVFSEQPLT